MSFWTRLFKGTAGERYEKGIRFFNEGRYDEAADLLEEVISESNHRGNPIAKLGAFYAAEAHAKIGMAHFYGGQLDQAFEHCQVALEENPHYPDLYYYLGVVHYRRGEHEQAIDQLTRATELNPDYAEAICYLGITLHDAGYFERAGEAFARALTLARETPNPISRILIDRLDARSFDIPVLQELREVVDGNTGFQIAVREGTGAFNRGDFVSASRFFGDAALLKPEYPDLHCRLGISLLEEDRATEAVRALQKAVELNVEYVDALYHLSIALFHEGEYVESRMRIEQAIALRAGFADVQCQYGIVLLALGEFDTAVGAFERAIEISPEYAKACYMLGLALHAIGRDEDASRSLQKALAIRPDLVAADMDSAVHSMAQGDWDDAVERLTRISTLAEPPADALCLLGASLLESDRVDEAIAQLEAALTVNPDYVEAKKFLALAHQRAGDHARAEHLISEALELHQDYPDLHKILGDIRLERGEAEAARRSYGQSLALNPHYSDALCACVIALRREGNGAEADAMLREFLSRHPGDTLARMLLTETKMKLPDA